MCICRNCRTLTNRCLPVLLLAAHHIVCLTGSIDNPFALHPLPSFPGALAYIPTGQFLAHILN
jgi:hypothetical protein